MRIKVRAYKTSPSDQVVQIDCLSTRKDDNSEPRLPWTFRLARCCLLVAITVFTVGGIVVFVLWTEGLVGMPLYDYIGIQ